MSAFLEFRGISKVFPGVRALSDVSFGIECGRVHGLLGENGAGKSTLLKILGGDYQPDGGQIVVEGKPTAFPTTRAALDAGIAVIHQELQTVPELTVMDNLLLGHLPASGGFIRQLGHRLQFALDLARKRNDDATAVRLHPLVNFDQKLILLALKIPTTEIHQVNDRFRGEQLVRVQIRDVRRIPVSHAVAHLLSVLEPREHFIHSLQFLLLLLSHRRARRARQSRVQFFLERSNEFNILLSQFTRDDLDVIHRIDPILDVNHVGVLEASHDVRDAIHRFNVRQERVPESRTRARSFHQSRDVDNLQKRLHHALRLVLLDQPIEAFVGDVDARRVGVDGAKREIFRGNRAVGERVVQRRFSDVWHADDAHLGRRRVVVSRRHSSFLSSSLSIIHSFIGVARAP